MLGPVRYDVLHIDLMASEIPYEDRCSRNAVAVIIAINEHLTVSVYGLVDNINGLTHIIVKERIVPDSVFFRQKLFFVLSFGYSAILKQNAKQRLGILDLARCR